MSSSALLAVAFGLGTLAPGAVLAYSTYKALDIRRSLATPIYRRHALWMGLVCAILAVNVFPNLSPGPYILAYNAVSVLVVLAWLDASIPVARRSDPLLREPLHWGKVRYIVWPSVFATQVLNQYFASYTNGSAIQGVVFLASLVVLAPPVLTVIVGARRAQDPVFRRSLGWVGVFLVLEIAQTLTFLLVQGTWLDVSNSDVAFWVNYSWGSWPSAVIVVFACYALYRAAGSLAPVNKLILAADSG